MPGPVPLQAPGVGLPAMAMSASAYVAAPAPCAAYVACGVFGAYVGAPPMTAHAQAAARAAAWQVEFAQTTQMAAQEGLVLKEGGQWWCPHCERYVDTGQLQAHIGSQRHTRYAERARACRDLDDKVRRGDIPEWMKVLGGGSAYCTLCNSTVTQEHLDSTKHQMRVQRHKEWQAHTATFGAFPGGVASGVAGAPVGAFPAPASFAFPSPSPAPFGFAAPSLAPFGFPSQAPAGPAVDPKPPKDWGDARLFEWMTEEQSFWCKACHKYVNDSHIQSEKHVSRSAWYFAEFDDGSLPMSGGAPPPPPDVPLVEEQSPWHPAVGSTSSAPPPPPGRPPLDQVLPPPPPRQWDSPELIFEDELEDDASFIGTGAAAGSSARPPFWRMTPPPPPLDSASMGCVVPGGSSGRHPQESAGAPVPSAAALASSIPPPPPPPSPHQAGAECGPGGPPAFEVVSQDSGSVAAAAAVGPTPAGASAAAESPPATSGGVVVASSACEAASEVTGSAGDDANGAGDGAFVVRSSFDRRWARYWTPDGRIWWWCEDGDGEEYFFENAAPDQEQPQVWEAYQSLEGQKYWWNASTDEVIFVDPPP